MCFTAPFSPLHKCVHIILWWNIFQLGLNIYLMTDTSILHSLYHMLAFPSPIFNSLFAYQHLGRFCDCWSPSFSLTGCLNSEIPKLQNAEIHSALKDQYIDTESVRFPCNTGFVGFFRVTCRNGVWRISGECQGKRKHFEDGVFL